MRPEDLSSQFLPVDPSNQLRPEDPSIQLPPRVGATVGLIGAVLITIGFIVDTLGEGMELSETIKRDKIAAQAAERQRQQLNRIQQKLDYLTGEIDVIKRRG